ncbi:MAG: hypothetical protein EOP51_09385 [Sphingobacteriales bacterium]|nr:MAG: hypothetical protein EOP51_09385 [Sphingobacteriales bacterium]
MENYFNREEITDNKLMVDEFGRSYLLDTARWGRFIGIVYTVAIALACLLFPFAMINNPQYESVSAYGAMGFVIIFYIVFVVGVNFYPLYAIIKSASQAKKALSLNDQQLLNDSFRLTRNLYKYLGILTIVLLCFYGIIMVFMVTIFATAGAI